MRARFTLVRQRVAARLALGWLAALMLAACAGPGPAPTQAPPGTPVAATSEATAAQATAGPTQPPANTPTPVPTPTPSVFSIGLVQTPQTLDPAQAVDETALVIVRHLYDGLFAYAPGTTQVQPALAESWSVSADGLRWTFVLRGGVTFSDGQPLTAEAARLNFERWLNGTPPGQYTFFRALFGGFAGEAGPDGEPLGLIERVSATSAQVLQVDLTRPAASLPNTLAMPSFALVSPAALDSPNPTAVLNAASAGTGPFVLAEWPQPDLVRLVRNPNHWDATRLTGPDELVFKVVANDTQRLLALQTGEIEALAHLAPEDYAAVAGGAGGTRLEFDPAINVLYLGFNHARSPWHNADCRQAVAHALNKTRYVQELFPGDAEPAAAMQPPAVWGYSASGEHAYDLALAQERLEACRASGATLPAEVTLYVPPIPRPYLPDPAALGAAIQADLAALGLAVTIASPEWQTEWLPDVHGGRADLFLLGWTGVNGDPDSFLCPLFCGAEGAFNTGDGGEPLPPDPQLASLLLEAQAVTDPVSRASLYAQAHARIFEMVPAVPLAHRKSAWAYRAGVQGNVPSPVESVFFGLRFEP